MVKPTCFRVLLVISPPNRQKQAVNLVSCLVNTLAMNWPILDAEVLRIRVCIPEGLCTRIRSGSAPKEANPLGAKVFWRTAAAKCDNDALHRFLHFAAPVHPEYPRPLQAYIVGHDTIPTALFFPCLFSLEIKEYVKLLRFSCVCVPSGSRSNHIAKRRR